MTGVTTPSAVSGPHGGEPLPSTELVGDGGFVKLKCADAVPAAKTSGTAEARATSV
jgi:hypothetical protein